MGLLCQHPRNDSDRSQVHLSDVCVLSLKEKCGRRLLSIATEISFQVRAETSEHAQNIVRDLESPTLDNMMLQANIRYVAFLCVECERLEPSYFVAGDSDLNSHAQYPP